ncbi:hypothetical protein JX266_006022 [Neoarthrinium moseri]|nr:hypothetical protein JX266_006022 [Neoarthrinium moseri]
MLHFRTWILSPSRVQCLRQNQPLGELLEAFRRHRDELLVPMDSRVKEDEIYPNDIPLEDELASSAELATAQTLSPSSDYVAIPPIGILLTQQYQPLGTTVFTTQATSTLGSIQSARPPVLSHMPSREDSATPREQPLAWDEVLGHSVEQSGAEAPPYVEPVVASTRTLSANGANRQSRAPTVGKAPAGPLVEDPLPISTDYPDKAGPKLARFRPLVDPLDIVFREEIHRGENALIWIVTCRGYTYALKLFAQSFDSCPFENECRAYGRLKETGKEHLAIECHGYIVFTSSYLNGKGIRLPQLEGTPQLTDSNEEMFFHALLKDLPPEPVATLDLTRTQLVQMSKDLLAVHRVGIFLGGELKPSSYIAGKLVDFGQSKTVPHPALDSRDGFEVGKDPQCADQVAFDERIVDSWNEKGASERRKGFRRLARVFCPEKRHYARLRGGDDRGFIRNLRLGEGWFNPAEYKWQVEDEDEAQRNDGRRGKRARYDTGDDDGRIRKTEARGRKSKKRPRSSNC